MQSWPFSQLKDLTMEVVGQWDTVSGACGLGNFNNFIESKYASRWGTYSNNIPDNGDGGGTGFFVAAFVESHICKNMYLELCSKYKLCFQSEVRKNANSGNEFFFCVFDAGEDAVQEEDDWHDDEEDDVWSDD
jgi:hypothetical protein